MTKRYQVTIYLLAACAAVTIAQSASAGIRCSNGYQAVDGNMLSTPYCRDQLVAEVAQQYGVRASANAIRNNPNFKRHVCRLIGQDIRIKESCDEVTPNGRGHF